MPFDAEGSLYLTLRAMVEPYLNETQLLLFDKKYSHVSAKNKDMCPAREKEIDRFLEEILGIEFWDIFDEFDAKLRELKDEFYVVRSEKCELSISL